MKFFLIKLVVFGGLALGISRVAAAPIHVPNHSFESPATDFVSLVIDSWQKTPKPDWYIESGGAYWGQLVGAFSNDTRSVTYIGNCDGTQAIWLFAVPEVGLFQDYDSIGSNETVPSHAFDALFEPGKSYELTVGLFGGGPGRNYGMQLGATLELSLYYRDANSNRVTVAATSITNSAELFTSNTNLVDFSVLVPTVTPDDVWAGKHIGIQFLSTVSPELEGGYWDLDNVRLVSIQAPIFLNPTRANGEFHCTIQSEPGLRFEIFASPELSAQPENWTSLGIITNSTGTIPFVDSTPGFDQRYYQARQVP